MEENQKSKKQLNILIDFKRKKNDTRASCALVYQFENILQPWAFLLCFHLRSRSMYKKLSYVQRKWHRWYLGSWV